MMRPPKTPEQVAAIEEVQRAADAALGEVLAYLRSSTMPMSEEAHDIIEKVLQRAGCESPEGHIVAGGAQSAEPHAKGSGPLTNGEPIVIDIYPRSKTTGYFADMSRTVCLGASSPELQHMYDTVLKAQEIGMSMLRPDMPCRMIQETVEDFFAKEGYLTSGKGKDFPFAEGFVHSVGHGVGLDIHEAPKIGRGSEDILQEGDVVTIEPGLYYKSVGGVRLEDILVITPDGSRNITKSPKMFIV